MQQVSHGILRFYDLTDFRRSTEPSLLDEAMEALHAAAKVPVKPPPTDDWLKITQSIRRGTLFSLSARAPGLEASIQFDPAAPNSGGYRLSLHRIETGRVESVTEVGEEAQYEKRFAALASFPMRYLVITCANDRQRSQRLWQIGISGVRDVSADEMEDVV